MKIFKIWDNIERSHYQDDYVEEGAAHAKINDLFNDGLYPDYPCTVLEVHEYNAGKFVKRIDYSQVKADEFNDEILNFELDNL